MFISIFIFYFQYMIQAKSCRISIWMMIFKCMRFFHQKLDNKPKGASQYT